MTDNESEAPSDPQGFGDILDELDDDTSFEWDDDDLEPEEEEETVPVVCIRLDDDLFALPGESVREIMNTLEATALPGAPDHIEGVAVVRRQVLGLLSLRRFLSLNDHSTRDSDDADAESSDGGVSTDRTLLVETDHYALGIQVDEVTGLEEWPASSIDTDRLPDNMHDHTRRYAAGAHRIGGGLCIYLDVDQLLDDAAAT